MGGTKEINPSQLLSLVQHMGHDDDRIASREVHFKLPSITSDVFIQLAMPLLFYSLWYTNGNKTEESSIQRLQIWINAVSIDFSTKLICSHN